MIPALRRFAPALVLLVAMVSCTVKTNPSDTTDAGAPTGTVGDQCTRIYTALCQRAISACGIQTDLNTCVTNGKAQCCVDKCAKAAITPNATIDSCVAAVSAEDCNLIVNNNVPGPCAGVPATQ